MEDRRHDSHPPRPRDGPSGSRRRLGQARDRHPRVRRLRAARDHRRVPALLGRQRPPGQVRRRRGRGPAAGPGCQAGPPGGRAGRTLGAPGVRRHRRPRPAQRGARVLRPRAALARLPDDRPAAGRARVPGRRPRVFGGRVRVPGGRVRVPDGRAQSRPVTRLVLVRHGQTAWNLEGRAQGHTDVGLDETGRAQATALAPYVAAMTPASLWSSDLARARQTADELAAATGLEVRLDARLREFDAGERAGLDVTEFAERFPEAHAAWLAGDVTGRVPGAETTEEVVARVVPALREIWAATD